MAVNVLEHITLTTGASRLSARREVADAAIDAVRMALADDGAIAGTKWSVALLPSPLGVFAFDLAWGSQPIASCWLCVNNAQSRELWTQICLMPTIPGTRLHEPIHIPWLAAALTVDPQWLVTSDYRNIMFEAGDLERIVAWALID
jgi:hypothetical protein